MIVVAEQTEQGAKLPAPTPDHPDYYIAFDSGYLEVGASVAGLKHPSPIAIGQALHTALSAAGYEVATAQNTPSLVLVYNYGSLRPGLGEDAGYSRTFQRISANLRARLNLVGTKTEVERAQDQLMYGSLIPYVPPTTQETINFAQEPRNFIVVSAYDYTGFIERTPTLLWRVRLSTLDTSGASTEIVPALAGASGPYLGRNFHERKRGSTQLPSAKESDKSAPAAPTRFVLPRNAVEKIDLDFLRNVMLQERATSSGNSENSAG